MLILAKVVKAKTLGIAAAKAANTSTTLIFPLVMYLWSVIKWAVRSLLLACQFQCVYIFVIFYLVNN